MAYYDHVAKVGRLPVNQANVSLKLLLANDLPPGFVRALRPRAEAVYRDAHDAVYRNAMLGDAEAEYLLGHQRRAMFETRLRDTAVEHGLTVVMERSRDEYGRQQGCKFVRVVAGSFSLTACHVPSPGAFPRHSRTREQYSKINEHADQLSLLPGESSPKDAELYGVIVHSAEYGNKDQLQSISIGFPTRDYDGWLQKPYDLTEIEAIQHAIYRRRDDLQGAIQKPTPRWRQDRTDKQGDAKE